MAESGNADVALTALLLVDRTTRHLWIVPETLHDPWLQEGAVVSRSPLPQPGPSWNTWPADAALTALSLMDKAGGHLWIVPETLHDPLLQDAAVVARSPHRQQAQAFVQFLAGPDARRVLEKHGFLLPRYR